jgi:hypothetical protein
MITEFLHLIIGTGSFTLGLLLPPDYLPFNILLVSVVIIGWQMLGYCLITKIISRLTGENENVNGDLNDSKDSRFLIPFSETFLKLYGTLIIGLSIFFSMKPQWAPYTILKYVVTIILQWILQKLK